MGQRAYRVLCTDQDGTIKSRDFLDRTKAQATLVRWARVPVFKDLHIVMSEPIIWKYGEAVDE